MEMGGAGSAWHRWEVRAFRVRLDGRAVGLTAAQAEVNGGAERPHVRPAHPAGRPD